MKRNYDFELKSLMEGLDFCPTLLLHSCCAPCSSAVLERLSEAFHITVFYYNPNITDEKEYHKRALELQKLLAEMKLKNPVSFIEGEFEPQKFLEAVQGFEQEKEGGARCEICFRLRLLETARMAKANGFDYFTTTLTISPLKNAALLNEIGTIAGKEYGVSFLPSDFKKGNGYQRSIELSKAFNLYRQDYCGCEFSKRERDERQNYRRNQSESHL